MARNGVVLLSVLVGGQLFLLLIFLDLSVLTSKRSSVTFSNQTKIIAPVPKVVPVSFLNPPTIEFPQKWTFTRSSLLNEGSGGKIWKERQDLLLLLRTLVLFSIREVNKFLEDTICVKWWVNPLSVTKLEGRKIDPVGTLYQVKFNAQPGNFSWESTVFVVNTPNNLNFPGTELVFVNASRLDPISETCERNVPNNLHRFCLCPDEIVEANQVTEKVRFDWKKTDPELFSWPPNSPMFVSDYITLGNDRLYVKTPSNNMSFCDPEVKMILFISSAPTHKLQRETIRKTFANRENLQPIGVRLVFLFGLISNKTLQAQINTEFELYDDIVQAEFADSYHNLSLSHLSMYNWVVTRCDNGRHMPKWVLKADDDFVLNVPLAINVAEANPDVEFLGIQFCGSKAIRDVRYMKKYYVPRYMYPPDYYAGYLSGVAYLVQTHVFKGILAASKNTPLTHMDDCYVMGLLTREIGLRPRNSGLITYQRIGPDSCKIKQWVSSYVYNSTDMEDQWKALNDPVPETCPLAKVNLRVNTLTSAVNHACFYE